jgi:hypothetical protein
MTGINWRIGFEEIPDAIQPEQPAATNGHDTARPVLPPAAYHGLAGEVVVRILPHTESDAAALLLQYPTYFGNAVGRVPYYLIDHRCHSGYQ